MNYLKKNTQPKHGSKNLKRKNLEHFTRFSEKTDHQPNTEPQTWKPQTKADTVKDADHKRWNHPEMNFAEEEIEQLRLTLQVSLKKEIEQLSPTHYSKKRLQRWFNNIKTCKMRCFLELSGRLRQANKSPHLNSEFEANLENPDSAKTLELLQYGGQKKYTNDKVSGVA